MHLSLADAGVGGRKRWARRSSRSARVSAGARTARRDRSVARSTIRTGIFLEAFPHAETDHDDRSAAGRDLSRLAGNLMIVVVFVMTAIGLTQFDALAPRPSAALEFSDPPGSGVIVRSEVIHLWLPEILVDPARYDFPAGIARTHQELKTSRMPRTGKPLVRNHRPRASSQPRSISHLVHPIPLPRT